MNYKRLVATHVASITAAEESCTSEHTTKNQHVHSTRIFLHLYSRYLSSVHADPNLFCQVSVSAHCHKMDSEHQPVQNT